MHIPIPKAPRKSELWNEMQCGNADTADKTAETAVPEYEINPYRQNGFPIKAKNRNKNKSGTPTFNRNFQKIAYPRYG